MRTRTIGWGLSVCVLVSVMYGAADAQAPSTSSPPADTSLGLQREVQLAPADQLKEANTYLGRMTVTGAGVRRMLEQARSQRDVVKTLCLNDKLNQIDVASRSAQDRFSALRNAVNTNEGDLATHEFTILRILKQRVEQLGAESNQCIGQELTLVGDSKVTTTVDPNLPPDESVGYPPVVIVSTPDLPVSAVQ